MALLLMLMLALLGTVVYGVKLYLKYSKEKEVLSLTIVGSPNQEVAVSVTLHGEIPVTSSIIAIELHNLHIPSSINSISASVEGVSKICPTVWYHGISINFPCSTSASISRGNIPAGTYDIELLLYPKPGVHEITYSVKATFRIRLGSSGKFTFTYNIRGLHLKYIEVSCDGIRKKITLAQSIKSTGSRKPTLPARPSETSLGKKESASSISGERKSTHREVIKITKPRLKLYKIKTHGRSLSICVRLERANKPLPLTTVRICANSTCISSETNSSGIACARFTLIRGGYYILNVSANNARLVRHIVLNITAPKVTLSIANGTIYLNLTNIIKGDYIRVYINESLAYSLKANKTGKVIIKLPKLNATGKIKINVTINNITVYSKTVKIGKIKEKKLPINNTRGQARRAKPAGPTERSGAKSLMQILESVLPRPLIVIIKIIFNIFALI